MIFDRGPLIDVVSWNEPSNLANPIYAYKYPGSNLSTFTQLIVRESQEAVLFTKGQLLNKFGPGKHTLNTENLPALRHLFGIPFGEKNPFTAEVWFVNKTTPLSIDWATSSMMHHDPDYNTMVPLCANGRYGLKVVDATRFLIKLVGSAQKFDADGLTQHFKGPLEAKTKSSILSYMQSQKIGIKSISAYLDQLSAALQSSMLAFWEDYGFNLVGFYITTIEVDANNPAGRQILQAMTDQSAQLISGHSWQQAKAFEVAAEATQGGGSSGLLGALLVTGMMGSGNAAGTLLQPNPAGIPSSGASGQVGSGTRSPLREVFCSNCAKKYSSASKFCPHCGDPYTPCPSCGADNDQRARRCTACGTTLAAVQTCPQCRSPLPQDANSCPMCGKFLASAANCTKCGSPLAAGSVFCGDCGQKVG